MYNLCTSIFVICFVICFDDFTMVIQYYMQGILLYDHWDNPRIVFDAFYQIAMIISFIARLVNEVWNYDKASFYNYNVLYLFFLFTYVYCGKTISDLIC